MLVKRTTARSQNVWSSFNLTKLAVRMRNLLLIIIIKMNIKIFAN